HEYNTVILKDWHREWPGADHKIIEIAEQGIDDSHKKLWRHTINHLGLAFYDKHASLLDSWRVLKSGRDATAASRVLRKVIANSINEEEKSIALQYLETLRKGRGDSARAFITAIASPESSSKEGMMQGVIASVDGVLQEQMDRLPELAAESASKLISNISTVLMFGLNVLLIPIYAFFLTLAMPTIRVTAKAYVPITGHDRTMRIIQKIEKAVAAFFRGRLIVCVICALLTWIGFLILGIPYAALFGLLIGLATAIPLAGLVFLVPAILLTIVEGGDNVALRVTMAIVLYGAVQALEATVFTPTIMGKEVELHPVLLIVALMLCGSLLGVLGLILAVPIAATVRIFAREFFLPKIREAAGVPSTMMLRKSDLGTFADNMDEHPSGASAVHPPGHEKIDEQDMSDFDSDDSASDSDTPQE
ncbi:MAG: AI-2E family transporter, partial [Planctomycetes bacterium]|nr:AI-2E family transporter [Planctomycetota bacterium]